MFKFKRLSAILLITLLFLSMSIAFADDNPITFSNTFTVTNDGGKFNVGFVEIEFKKNSLPANINQITLNAEIYAENGTVYIEFRPDVEKFDKHVHIRVDNYKGFIYDKTLGKNTEVNIKKFNFIADHFSRYALAR
ncbi:hypothetical protein ACAG39_10770 [Caldicellulosiruptoraceae bacterium PP1]